MERLEKSLQDFAEGARKTAILRSDMRQIMRQTSRETAFQKIQDTVNEEKARVDRVKASAKQTIEALTVLAQDKTIGKEALMVSSSTLVRRGR